MSSSLFSRRTASPESGGYPTQHYVPEPFAASTTYSTVPSTTPYVSPATAPYATPYIPPPGTKSLLPETGTQVRFIQTNLSKGEFRLYVAVIVQVTLTVLVLAMSLGLVSTQPPPDSVPSRISFAVFVTIFSLVGCVYIFILAPRIEDAVTRKGSCAIVGALSFIFYVSGTLALTVGIAPGGSCLDDTYTTNNELIAGVPSRCRLLQADITMFWLGTHFSLPILTLLAMVAYGVAGILKIKDEWAIEDETTPGVTVA
jgi:hypothetical protein